MPSTAPLQADLPANADPALLAGLRNIAGSQHVLTGDSATRRYRRGSSTVG